MEAFFAADLSIAILVVILVIAVLRLGIKVVPQSEVFVIERFGKYARTLNAGLSLIIPILDRVAHRVSILERQLDEQRISVITKDNVEVTLETRVFFRVTEAARSVYRIRNVNDALVTASSSIVRSAAGKLELDELQSSREAMNQEIAHNLHSAAEVWGIEITRTEITDVIVDDATKEAQRQQLNAERKRRATIAEAEGEKRSIELKAEAELFKAKKEAEAVKVAADADAYAVRIQAEAEAEQTRMLADAIAKNGKPAIDFEVAKRQIDAIGALASSDSAKTLILPTDVTGVIGAASTLIETLGSSPDGKKKMSDVYFSLSYWLYLPQTWIIIGIIGILLELTDGSRIFFLPIGLAGLVVSAHVKLTFDNAMDPDLLPEAWYWLAMEWMIIAAAISVLVASYRRMMPKSKNPEDDDINSY